ncbi:unnamed protein product (macronuclear) [Paramecium tetraurelia]|uniref:Transmembrane protein n=1 Tax=Paramecium tetraurelia TaxID=5888 RepID=A0DVZ9_PARTE|nr:uncharacterized protein GSPATT00020869001 [Paramecium tetraurelia]CAK87216.1 unnamed protein product [Paramecium tetraurelia]|eukprot:XP_001454613.1 hypothetical protein (macronuclear) [Paramecium tetraurelia strain d4-2]
MNSLTLRFNDQEFERHYKISRQILLNQSFFQQKILLMILLILQVADNALSESWVELIYNTIGLMIILLSHYFRFYLQEFQELCILITILIYNIQQPIDLLLRGRLINNYFSNGYFISLATLGVISPMDFLKKLSIAIIILIVHLISSIQNDLSWRQLIIYIISDVIIVYYFYISEKESRITYIGIKNKNIIEEHFYKEMDLQSFIVHYNNQQNSFNLIEQNQNKEINEETQFNFIQLIRKIRVMVGYQGTKLSEFYSQEQLNICRKLNLEQFLFYLFTNEEKLQYLIYNKSKTQFYQLIGLIDSDVNHIKIIKTFDTEPCVIILIKQNKKEAQKQQIKLKLKIANKLIDQASQTVQQQLRLSLIYLKQLLNNQITHQISLHKFDINLLMKLINSKAIKVYNDLNNISDFHDINGKFNKIESTQFNIEKIIQECIMIIKYYNSKQQLPLNFLSKLKQKWIFSDQKKLKQLILNVLFFLSKTCTNIKINLIEDNCNQEINVNETILLIDIQFQGLALTQEKLNNFPIINPQNIEELKHNNNKQLELEIPIALMIVRQLGPFNQIKFKQGTKNQTNFIQFYLFQELQEFNLIPIISLHPKEYLITHQKFVKKQSQTYKILDLPNKTIEIQMNTFRNLNDKMITRF